MSMTAEMFEVEPFRHELEAGGRSARGVRSMSRRPVSKPWPSFRKRRILRTPIDLRRMGRSGARHRRRTAGRSPSRRHRPDRRNMSAGCKLRSIARLAGPSRWMALCPRPCAMRSESFSATTSCPRAAMIGPDTEAALRRVRSRLRKRTTRVRTGDRIGRRCSSGGCRTVAGAKRCPSGLSSRALGRPPVPGLYRFFAADGRFYTGMATDLRRRIIQHLWCPRISPWRPKPSARTQPNAGQDQRADSAASRLRSIGTTRTTAFG